MGTSLRSPRLPCPRPQFRCPPVASDGTITGDKSAFSIHCYRSMLATDFAAYGLPSSLRKPRAASSFDTPRNDSCPPLGRRRRRLRARATTSGLVSLRGFLPSHRPSRSRLRFRAAANFATLLAFSNWAIAPSRDTGACLSAQSGPTLSPLRCVHGDMLDRASVGEIEGRIVQPSSPMTSSKGCKSASG